MQSEKTWAERPGAILIFICVLQTLTWTLAPSLTHFAPPLDAVESYLWGREWVWATYKHPSLPGWALEASYLLTGSVGWPSYLLSQIMIVASFGLVFLIGRDLFGPDLRGSQKALAGVLLLTGIYYYSLSTVEFNHNIAQMPFYAAVILALWRGVTRGDLIWWIMLGVAAGLGIQAKYSFGVLLAVAAFWLVAEPRGRQSLAGIGPWIAAAIFLLAAAPQIRWLIQSGFLPLQYAAGRAEGATTGNPFHFLLAQLADHAGLFVLAGAAGMFGGFQAPVHRSKRRLQPEFGKIDAKRNDSALTHERSECVGALGRAAFTMGGLDPFASRFLLTFSLGPVLLPTVLALIGRTGMKDMWAMPMFNLVGLLLVALVSERVTPAALRRLAVGATILLVVVPLGYAAVMVFGGSHMKKPLLVVWPQAEMSKRFHEIWHSEVKSPLGIVAGDIWTAGVVALTAPDRPSVFTDANPLRSAWITPERVAREGALVVWQQKAEAQLPTQMVALIGSAPRRETAFAWPDSPSRPPLRIGYAIVPPSAPGGTSGATVSSR